MRETLLYEFPNFTDCLGKMLSENSGDLKAYCINFLAMFILESNVEIEESPQLDVDVLDEVTKPWQVMILNDPVNLMSFVTLILRRISWLFRG